ncbi:Response regulator of the LytR/AlgR family protein [Thalassovita gelatinovora]|uniref:Response regulator of the LytR/AlgR family protein n=1 Tax=Thalassovita gelatinovora TaxID=53501 RepID=A0A0P1FXX7_THAGE|nr:LytTR family DNA-binding domain-containing protein [Thalassovita gelatinovora]QIZ80326.1 LytTR family transcriptional regulator [Thalassovita gelatinovora]CUH64240.1 Response regulator of the LytR/AlgR family protein [Thalassovita gelatinovora]SEQ94541.1 transcriptional regulator, LytTR family [Thalassovita gelatinovora]
MNTLVFRAFRHTFSYPPVAIWSLMAIGAAIMGPFGTYSVFGWWARVAYWFVICGSSVFVAYLVRVGVSHFVRDDNSFLFDTLNVFGFTLVFSPIAYGLTVILSFDLTGTIPPAWQMILFVFLVATMVNAFRRVHRNSQLSHFAAEETGSLHFEGKDGDGDVITDEPPQQNSATSDCRLLERLPDDIRAPILHLSARDHFVDVETQTALYSLRMRFSDAVAEMNGVEGFNTHRSHWVAREAIRSDVNKDGKLFLVLTNGTEVPVSRSFRPQLIAAGVIAVG